MADRRESRRHAAFGALTNSVLATAVCFFGSFFQTKKELGEGTKYLRNWFFEKELLNI